ncbi:MAG TPA: hypothetical protein VG860_11945 [Terriglobia bacterium]|jgi:hypothetical protein|nr:hypothetical protein [Terriglobia bacterium]
MRTVICFLAWTIVSGAPEAILVVALELLARARRRAAARVGLRLYERGPATQLRRA